MLSYRGNLSPFFSSILNNWNVNIFGVNSEIQYSMEYDKKKHLYLEFPNIIFLTALSHGEDARGYPSCSGPYLRI